LADLKQRIIGSAINEWQKPMWGCVMPKDSNQTRVKTVDTAKHFIIPTETLFVKKNYLLCS